MYIEQEGEMDIINHTTGERCHLKYTCGGMFSRDRTVNYQIIICTNLEYLETPLLIWNFYYYSFR